MDYMWSAAVNTTSTTVSGPAEKQLFFYTEKIDNCA